MANLCSGLEEFTRSLAMNDLAIAGWAFAGHTAFGGRALSGDAGD